MFSFRHYVKTNAERADDIKDRLILKKMEEDDAKTKAQQEMMTYVKMQEKCKEEFSQSMNAVQVQSLQHLVAFGKKLEMNSMIRIIFLSQRMNSCSLVNTKGICRKT